MVVSTFEYYFVGRIGQAAVVPRLTSKERTEIIGLIRGMMDEDRPRQLINGAVQQLVEEALLKTGTSWSVLDSLVKGFNTGHGRAEDAPCLSLGDRARIRLEICGYMGAKKSFPYIIVHVIPMIEAACVYASDFTLCGVGAVEIALKPFRDRL